MVVLGITDSSGHAAASVPSSSVGTWTLIQNGTYASLWIGTKLSSTAFTITVTCTNGSNQGCAAVPVFLATGSVTSSFIENVSSSAWNSSNNSLTATVTSLLIFVAAGNFSSGTSYTVGPYNNGSGNEQFVAPLFTGVDTKWDGLLSVVPVPAGTYTPALLISAILNLTDIAALLT